METSIIIQARMTSHRLPGKVLLPINRKPVLWYVVHRLRYSKHISKVIIATSIEKSDDLIAQFCKDNSTPCYRGNLENVLDRYYQTAQKVNADVIIRVTGDCPLIDASLIDQGYEMFVKSQCDYVSNTVRRTYPRGFDFEIFSFSALEKAYRHASERFEKEHVTPYIWKTHRNKFKTKQLIQSQDFSRFRITVDTPEDLEVIKILIEKYRADRLDYNQITNILRMHPEIIEINKNVEQKHL